MASARNAHRRRGTDSESGLLAEESSIECSHHQPFRLVLRQATRCERNTVAIAELSEAKVILAAGRFK